MNSCSQRMVIRMLRPIPVNHVDPCLKETFPLLFDKVVPCKNHATLVVGRVGKTEIFSYPVVLGDYGKPTKFDNGLVAYHYQPRPGFCYRETHPLGGIHGLMAVLNSWVLGKTNVPVDWDVSWGREKQEQYVTFRAYIPHESLPCVPCLDGTGIVVKAYNKCPQVTIGDEVRFFERVRGQVSRRLSPIRRIITMEYNHNMGGACRAFENVALCGLDNGQHISPGESVWTSCKGCKGVGDAEEITD